MKSLFFILFMLAFVQPVSADVLDSLMNRPWSSDRRDVSDQETESPNSPRAMQSEAVSNPSPMGMVVRGVVVDVQPNGQNLTIVDDTRTRRLFLADKRMLMNLQPGSKVKLTTFSDNLHKVQSINHDSGLF